jgi:hypothetical protein
VIFSGPPISSTNKTDHHAEIFLKIPKGQSETVYRRKTENKMANKMVQKNKQRSTKHTYKTQDRVIRTPLKPGISSGAQEG